MYHGFLGRGAQLLSLLEPVALVRRQGACGTVSVLSREGSTRLGSDILSAFWKYGLSLCLVNVLNVKVMLKLMNQNSKLLNLNLVSKNENQASEYHQKHFYLSLPVPHSPG